MSPSVLLIAPEATALPIADALRADLRAEVETTPSRRSALASLRRREFEVVLLDENLASAEPAAADLLYQSAGATPIVELNFAISSASRIVRQTRAALARRSHDNARARAAAAVSLQGELNAALSGILLESEMALRDASPVQAPRLRHLVQLAGDLRDRLRA
jgi:hypothetical protein